MKKKIGRLISVFLAVCLCAGSMPFNSLAEEMDEEITEQEVSETYSSGSTYEYENGEYKVIYTLNDIWDSGYNLGVTILNNGDDDITDWAAQIPFDDEITSSWGIEEISNESGVLRFKNLGWNSDIYAHQNVNFGFIANGQFDGFPQSFTFMENDTETHVGIEINLSIPQQWEGGFNGFLEITNNTEESYSNWQIEFDYNNEIVTFWGAKIVSHVGNHYVVKPYENTTDFVIGQTVSYGFQVHEGDSSEEIINVVVTTTEPEIHATQQDDEEWINNGSYFKNPSAEDIIYDVEYGETYVRNQLVVGVMLGIDKKFVIDMAEHFGASIVGYISKMEMYQFEFSTDKTYSELDELIEEIESYSFVTYAMLNYVEGLEETYYPTEGYKNSWSVSGKDLEKWGLRALNLPSAWDYRSSFVGPVKVGICDNCFFDSHPDLVFKKLINNTVLVNGNIAFHGTHVAGTIGATFDNGIGISGVATNVSLYGYSKYNIFASTIISESSQYAELIYNNVRVINISYGYSPETVYLLNSGNQQTRNKIEKQIKVLAKNLENLILSGYDFLIVNAAGNYSNKDLDSKYEVTTNASNAAYHITEQDALYGYYANGITDAYPIVKSRIIVVGAAEIMVDNSGNVSYGVTNYSGRGNRVDVYAPGSNIYSTVPYEEDASGYAYKDGTSMATPHITGIAALIWQANPYLTAPEVKNIITSANCRGVEVTDSMHPNSIYYMPDAELCVKVALGLQGGISSSDNDMPKGTAKGKVVDENGNPLSGITIFFVRTSPGEANLKDYFYKTTTNASGEYDFYVPSGEYELSACSPDGLYLPASVSNISVDPSYIRYIEDVVLINITDNYVWGSSVVVSGTVYNAITGAPIPNAIIHSRTNWNTTDGRYSLGDATSDTSGLFELPLEALGNYTVEIQASGYITGYFNVVGVLDTVGANQSFILTPVLSDDEYRIILTWDDDPNDLDSHLTYDMGAGELMHVFFGNRNGYLNGNLVASLDLDDTSGYGPETITMTLNASDLSNGGCFTYYVHKFSGNEELRQSSAIVRLYSGNTLLETYYVPDSHGNDWFVFKLTENGLVNINRIS
ncbi:MAG: S8 family serine peptidase [Lachnospiraceae bacterium]|nr:S8 family serine peptidase [Lachnospiraceae bacterium]